MKKFTFEVGDLRKYRRKQIAMFTG